MKHSEKRSDCPVSLALDVFGDKWSLLIVRDLLFRGKVHYGDFLNAGEDIATNILADRLRLMEQSGILTKTKDPKAGNKVIYSLTPKGVDLLPILVEMILWSVKHVPQASPPESLLTQITKDKTGFIKRIQESMDRKLP